MVVYGFICGISWDEVDGIFNGMNVELGFIVFSSLILCIIAIDTTCENKFKMKIRKIVIIGRGVLLSNGEYELPSSGMWNSAGC